MRRALLIYNPFSGQRVINDNLGALVDKALSLNVNLIPMRISNDSEDMDFICQLIKEPSIEFVIVSGGDGSVSNISKLILDTRPDLPIGVIPGGTANDFCHSIDMPDSPFDALEIVINGSVHELDVGLVNNKRLFMSSCAAGMFVNSSFSTSNELKKSIGPLAYYFTGLGEIPKIKPFDLKVTYDNGVIEGKYLLYLLINGRQAAGMKRLYTKAELSDGMMDLLLIKNVPPIELPYLLKDLINREEISEGKYFQHILSSKFVIESDSGILTTQDGEEGLNMPLNIEVLHKALKVLY